jgi:hypothetical protein
MREPNKSESFSTDWKVHIQDWQTTEQSQSAYCKSHDLNYHCFIYWRRKLAGPTQSKTTSVQPSAFVSVQSSPAIVAEDLSLTLPNGITLQGIISSNLAVVQQLLGLLT